jgi:putative ABC transport system permease protein
MSLLQSARTACRSLGTHTLRTGLALLAVAIGVAAVLAMVALGKGAEARVVEQMEALGSNLIIVLSGSATSGGLRLGTGSRLSLTQDDAAAIQREVDAVQVAAPSMRGNVQVVSGGLNWATYMLGVTPEFLEARDWELAAGRPILPADVDGAAKVALVGQTVVQNLFAGGDPLGQGLRISRVPFTVVGVLGPKGHDRAGQDWDDIVLVPLSTARTKVLGVSPANARAVTAISVKVRAGEDMAHAEAQVRSLLRQRHRLQLEQPDDFRVTNLSEVLETHQEAARVMMRLLAAIAAISLLVGGVGITNLMLVSIAERTREVGLRMAVGARQRDIRLQFLVEAGTLALLGGVLGIGMGVGGAYGLTGLMGWPTLVPPWALALAVGFSAAVGVLFGLYPAERAARLDPIAALGQE